MLFCSKKQSVSRFMALIIPLFLAFFSCATRTGAGKPAKPEPTPQPRVIEADRLDLEYDPNRLIFLLIGQSNMEGLPRPGAAEDVEVNPRVHVLAYTDAPGYKRLYNHWYPAKPPLHNPDLGVGIGDYFGKTLAEALPENYSIGLVPCGISGVDIDFFRKNVVSQRRAEFRIPPDNSREGAYAWVLERARLAQQVGVISGILFHHGESDAGQTVWLDKVKEMVTDLRTDLGIGEVPFLVGELYYKGVCAGHNEIIRRVPELISNSYVISAEGLQGVDQFHFNLEGQRELGRRYGKVMLEALGLTDSILK